MLFIDEACYLYRDSDARDYGQEAVVILLQVMENQRDRPASGAYYLCDEAEVVLRTGPQ